jgi:hypothetical protein
MKVKGQKTSYGGNAELFDGLFGEDLEESDGLWEDLKLPDVEFYPICASLSENFGTLTMKIYKCRISNRDLHLRFRPTIFGYVLKDILDLDAVGGGDPTKLGNSAGLLGVDGNWSSKQHRSPVLLQ